MPKNHPTSLQKTEKHAYRYKFKIYHPSLGYYIMKRTKKRKTKKRKRKRKIQGGHAMIQKRTKHTYIVTKVMAKKVCCFKEPT